jgi:acetyl-CoA carboxylase biotin carboxyl carrier protein
MSAGLRPEEVAAILRVIDETDFKEISLRSGDLSVTLRRGEPWEEAPAAAPPASAPAPGPAPVAAVAPPASAGPPPAADADPARGEGAELGQQRRVTVVSPLLGTFYRRASPGEDPLVDVGSEVTDRSVVCIVEVMKMMNSIQAGVSGRIVEVLVEDGQLVESGADLFVVEPDADGEAH